MVYTVTFNPSIDYVVSVDRLKNGEVNRAASEQMFCGGKGINVSVVLSELGVRSKALGFIAGFTGKAIADGVRAMGVETDLIELDEGFSRINVKMRSTAENTEIIETELNGSGPTIPREAIDRLYEKLDALRDGDILVLAGSVPSSLPSDIYERILERMSAKRIKTVVDATKDLLLNVLKYEPFLIKPNDRELGELFGTELRSVDEIVFYARKLKEMGAANVLVSMAGDGALLIDESGTLHRRAACHGVVKNSVGAGDSMLAGFIAGLQNGDCEYALKLGTAAGGATAFSDGLADKDTIFKLLAQMERV